MGNIAYFEWVPTGTWVKTLAGFVSLVTVFVLVITIAVGVAVQNPFLIVILASALAFVLFMVWNYRGIQIQVTNKELSISYGFFNRRHIPISNIVACEHTKAHLWKYGGVGVRYCFTECSWAYIASFGDAVRIVRREGRPFVFSSNNPEKLCDVIHQIKECT